MSGPRRATMHEYLEMWGTDPGPGVGVVTCKKSDPTKNNSIFGVHEQAPPSCPYWWVRVWKRLTCCSSFTYGAPTAR